MSSLRATLAYHFLLRCFFGIGGALAVTYIQLRLERFPGPFLPLFFWCLICSSVLGTGPSLAVIAISTLLTNYCFVAPALTFHYDGIAAMSSVAFATMALMGLWFLTSIFRHTRLQENMLRQAQETAAKKEKLAEALEAAVRIRDNFVATASHELRTPLTHLYLRVQKWNRKLTQTDFTFAHEQMVAAWSEQQRGVERLVRMVDQLLDVSRIDLDRLDLRPTYFSISEVLGDIKERFLDELREANSELILSGRDAVNWAWDRERFDQVVSNLVSNALKYAPGTLIVVSWVEWKDTVKISVQDFGPGLSQEAQKVAFGRFERMHAGDTAVPGLGLGLWICRKVVEGAGGTIELASENGMGCKFLLTLPGLCTQSSVAGVDYRPSLEVHRQDGGMVLAVSPSRR